MQIMPPDFPEQITFNYLLNKCYSHIKEDFLKITKFALLYLLISIPLAFIPVIGPIIGHIFLFGVIMGLNQFRMHKQFSYRDLFWGFSDWSNFKKILLLSTPYIPLFGILTIIMYLYQYQESNFKWISIFILGLILIYVFIILLISPFAYVIEQNSAAETFKRSHQILKGNFLDVSLILTWIIILNLVGIITIIGVIFTAQLSVLVMLELFRYLIRKYELKELTF